MKHIVSKLLVFLCCMTALIGAEPDPTPGSEEEVPVPVLVANIIIDSNNDNSFFRPGEANLTEDVETEEDAPGKIFMDNSGDSDGDGIADFFDGFDLITGEEEDLDKSVSEGGGQFIPVLVKIGVDKTQEGGSNKNVNEIENVLVSFSYSSNNPNDITPPAEAEPYPELSGSLRLWTKDKAIDRNKAVAGSEGGGDFIDSATSFPIEDLGFSFNGKEYLQTFYVEGITPGLVSISVSVSGDNARSSSDSCALSPIRLEWVVPSDPTDPDSAPVATSVLPVSTPRPIIVLTEVTKPDANKEKTKVTISGEIYDAIADNVSGTEANIESITATIDGQDTKVAVIAGEDEGEGFWRQYPYKGTFTMTVPVTREEGTKVILLETTENKAGFTGTASVTVTFAQKIIPGGR